MGKSLEPDAFFASAQLHTHGVARLLLMGYAFPLRPDEFCRAWLEARQLGWFDEWYRCGWGAILRESDLLRRLWCGWELNQD
jgi:hypothetical protein